MPLNVIVVGAGIAGLTAATALSQNGHHVQVLEKSSFKTEVGAALNLMPNGSYVLRKLGFDFQRAQTGRHDRLETVNGVNLEPLTCIDLAHSEEIFGGKMQSVLRADLHSELLRLSQSGPNPAVLHLGCKVQEVDPEQGIITLETGEKHQADLIVAADGSHSSCRQAVLGQGQEPMPSGKNAFRFLLKTEDIEHLEALQNLLATRGRQTTIFADIEDKSKTRHLAWYPCHGGTIQNLVGIYPADEHKETIDNKTLLLEQFKHFHPDVISLLKMSDDVRVWPLRFDDPFDRYSRGRIVLLGDAAHTMLPFSGQGANQAIEGAGMLGNFFRKAEPSDVTSLIQQFSTLRQPRIGLIKLLSRIRFGQENDHAYGTIHHDSVNMKDVPKSFTDRLRFEWLYNTDNEYEKYRKSLALDCQNDFVPVGHEIPV